MIQKALRIFFVILFAAIWSFAMPSAPAMAATKSKNPQQQPVEVKKPEFPTDLYLVDVGVVSQIRKSDMITLKNRRSYRLSNIRVPVSYEFNATEYLKNEMLNRKVGVYVEKKAEGDMLTDRYGNAFVHILRDDGVWIQAGMIGRGLSWAYSTETTATLGEPLLQYERMARNARLGFWEEREYNIKDKLEIEDLANTYQVFEGPIDYIQASADGKFYTIYFAPSKHEASEFTVILSRVDMDSNFKGLPPGDPFRDWRAKTMRIHGWVEEVPAKHIILTHPEQMELFTSK